MALSLHGFALAMGASALHTANPLLAGVLVAAALAPWVAWAGDLHPIARRPWFAFGAVAGSWLIVGTALETAGPGADASRVVLVATGLLAHLVAASVMDARPPTAEGLVVQPTGRIVSRGTLRRARLRALLVGGLGLAFVALIAYASAFHEDTSRLERTFAVVIVSVLATSVLLLVVPDTVRRSRRTLPPTGVRVRGALLALLGAGVVMGLEYWTR